MTIEITTAVPYAEISGFRPLELDLYRPGPGDWPVVMYLHGGGWQRGSRRSVSPTLAGLDPPLFQRVVEAGIAVVSVDYRLSGEARYPAQLEDVNAAATWLTAEGPARGVDPSRLVLWGDSAGGHLAAMAALTWPTDHPPPSGVVLWYAPTDLVGLEADAEATGGESHAGADSREGRLLGGPIEDRLELATAASPLRHVSGGAPPFLLVHGTTDRAVPHPQSERFVGALIDAGNEAELLSIEGAGHMWAEATGEQLEDIVARTTAFLARHTQSS
jgi:acetyl esterase/lipase